MTLHIAFSATDSYVNYLGTTVYSICQHHPDQDIHVYVLSSHLSDHSLSKLDRLANDRLTIEWLQVDQSRFDGLPLKHNISIEAYYRMLLPELLPDLERVLYLDCDILIKGDLIPFWETDLTGYYAAGVNERDMLYRNPDYRQSIGYSPQDIYVNSGVLLLNLEALRADQMVKTLFDNAQALKDKISYQDQDVINITLKGRIKNLPAIYNYTSYEREVDEIPLEDVVVIHYNWHKPWVDSMAVLQYNYPTFALYQEAYRAYLHQVEPLMTVLVMAEGRQHLEACLDSLLTQTYQNLEILVLGLSGEMAEQLHSYRLKDSRVRFLESAEPAPWLPALYEQGVAASHGQVIALMDGDEWADANYLSDLYNHLAKQGADVALSSFSLFNDQTGIYSLFDVDIKPGQARPSQLVVERFYGLKWFEHYRHLALTGKLYHRQVFERAADLGEFKSEAHWALALLFSAGQVAFASERLYVRRVERLERPAVDFDQKGQEVLDELKSLLLYCGFRGYDMTHLKTYYEAEVNRLLGTQADDPAGYDRSLAQLMASRSLNQLP